MRRLALFLLALGTADLLIAAACLALHSLAIASQYTGLLAMYTARNPALQPRSPELDEVRLDILRILSRTDGALLTVLLALAISGVAILVAGWRMRRESRQTVAG